VRRRIESQFETTDPARVLGAVSVQAYSRPTIERAIQLLVSDKRSQGLSIVVLKKYELELGRFKEYMGLRSRFFPYEITQEILTEFRAGWDKLYPSSTTRVKVQERLRGFLRYCYELRLIDRIPRLSAIQVEEPPTLSLSDEEYGKLLKAIPGAFESDKAKRVRALIRLMRHSGLAIRDAVTLGAEEIQADDKKNVYRVVTSRQKTGTHVSVPISDEVAKEILAVQGLNGNPDYIFWNTGRGMPQTVVKKWHVDLRRAFDAAGLTECHPHQLRDTFAVSLLSKGVPMEEVSRLLGHESIKTTERHYAKWVPKRQDRLDQVVIDTWDEESGTKRK
jgi:integrase/recombinase XerD